MRRTAVRRPRKCSSSRMSAIPRSATTISPESHWRSARRRGRPVAAATLRYRFVFAPGTIGSITWLARNEQNRAGACTMGSCSVCAGDRGPLTYKRSRRGDTRDRSDCGVCPADRCTGARVVDFSPYGYDERQLCSPGFDLPVGRLTRTPNNEYPEYHSSADNFDLIDSRRAWPSRCSRARRCYESPSETRAI